MVIAYFDCFSGVAGDMVLGAMVDAGMPLAHLKKQLARVSIGSYAIVRKKDSGGIGGTNVRVDVRGKAAHARYRDLDRLIARSRLPKPVRETARQIFSTLARAEAKVHGVPLDRVHFHEVGAIDSVVDVVGAAIGIDWFGFDEIFSSPLPVTRGRVKTAHGWLPVPAPATLEILKTIPLEPSPIEGEIVTPTGAAILSTVVSQFGECPLQSIDGVGYGFGDRKIPGHINALRLMIGEGFPAVVIETDIDDMNPQLFDAAIERCFSAGAVDVSLQPIQMKKNRPAVRLCAIAPWAKKNVIIDAILRETTSFGVRYRSVERKMLTRELVVKKVKRGNITIKIGRDAAGRIVKAVPEYESVRRRAKKIGHSLSEAYQEAMAAGAAVVSQKNPPAPR